MDIHCIQTGIFKVNTYIVPIGDGKCFIVDPAACKFTRDTEKFSAYLESTGLMFRALSFSAKNIRTSQSIFTKKILQ